MEVTGTVLLIVSDFNVKTVRSYKRFDPSSYETGACGRVQRSISFLGVPALCRLKLKALMSNGTTPTGTCNCSTLTRRKTSACLKRRRVTKDYPGHSGGELVGSVRSSLTRTLGSTNYRIRCP